MVKNMGKAITKLNNLNVKLKDKEYGNPLRLSYQREIMSDETLVPKKLEYEDIDYEFTKFVEEKLEMVVDGEVLPTYTLFSNQRFSEYSQTWEHTDDEENLLMNFKTIIRENNPKFGKNQDDNVAIPGDRKYTVLMRTVLEDNGDESYEIYTIKQPFTIDLTYKVSLITDKFENLNKFNMLVQSLFKAKQYYIRPNGHFVPMILEDISDETTYGVDERKFFIQTYTIRVMSYIIREEDIEIQKVPKRKIVSIPMLKKNGKAIVELSEYEDSNSVEIYIHFPEGTNTVKFESEFKFVSSTIELINIRKIKVNAGKGYIDITDGTPVIFNEGDGIRIKIIKLSDSCDAEVRIIGEKIICQND